MPIENLTLVEAIEQLKKPFDPFHRDLAALRTIVLYLLEFHNQQTEEKPANAESPGTSLEEESPRKRIKGKKG